jgi:hypothetical protein
MNQEVDLLMWENILLILRIYLILVKEILFKIMIKTLKPEVKNMEFIKSNKGKKYQFLEIYQTFNKNIKKAKIIKTI